MLQFTSVTDVPDVAALVQEALDLKRNRWHSIIWEKIKPWALFF